jgi:hypothetical protein
MRAVLCAGPVSCPALTRWQLWKIEEDTDGQKVDYIATLAKHTQAVNVVRWAPKGEPNPLPRVVPNRSTDNPQARSSHLPATTET